MCKPLYTEVFKDNRDNVVGVVEFESKEDMKATVRKVQNPGMGAGKGGLWMRSSGSLPQA